MIKIKIITNKLLTWAERQDGWVLAKTSGRAGYRKIKLGTEAHDAHCQDHRNRSN